jgi:hypothetical protein
MLKRLKRWLGWDADSSLFDFSELRNQPPRTIQPRNVSAPVGPPIKRPSTPPPSAATSSPQRREKKRRERDALDVLDNPKLTLDKPADDGFDPYNTGAFNRSTSWEKIGRHRKR